MFRIFVSHKFTNGCDTERRLCQCAACLGELDFFNDLDKCPSGSFLLKFGEIAKEMTECSEDYDGWISRGWIQEEYIHVDVLPATLELPRRYAFRYLEIEAIDTSMKWQLVVDDAVCRSISAVDATDVPPLACEDETQKK